MPAIVEHSGAIGFVASALVLGAFGMKDMVNLRIVAICSNIAFIAYALVLSLPPILILHIILLPLNGWRLMEALKQRSAAHAPLFEITPWRYAARAHGCCRWPRSNSTLGPDGFSAAPDSASSSASVRRSASSTRRWPCTVPTTASAAATTWAVSHRE
jgi:hypothetical protein